MTDFIMPRMPEGEPSQEDRVFDDFWRTRALFGIPGSLPLVKEADTGDWQKLWGLLLGRQHGTE